jgi:hypothetical protein
MVFRGKRLRSIESGVFRPGGYLPIELFVQKRQNTDYTLKMVIFRVKIEILNLFFVPFSIDKTKWLNILDLAMVSQSVLF